MQEQRKLQTLLELIIYLSSGIKYSLPQIMARFELTERTARRYIKLLREAGFKIPRPIEGFYYIDKKSPYFKELSELVHFSKEEAQILYLAIHSINNENLLKQNLIYKLHSLYDSPEMSKTIIKFQHSNNVHVLTKAIQSKQQVELIDYNSANSNNKSNRIIEPFAFTTNYVDVWAYELTSKTNKLFKISRISSVIALCTEWQNESNHKQKPSDVFRISNDQKIPVKLLLSTRACELLKEEYPLAEPFIKTTDNNQYLLETEVCGFEGVGRFVLGLCHEIDIIEPVELNHFISNRIKKYLN